MTPAPISILELRSVRGTGGGPEKTILLGAARADRSRFAVTVCYVRDLRDDVFAIDRRAQQTAVDYVEVTERHSLDASIWPALKALVRDRRIDIIHGHDYKTDLLAFLLARRTGALAFSTAHGWTGQSARERFIYYPLHKRLLARFPRVVAVSGDVKAELVGHGARAGRVTVLLNGIDASAFRRDPARCGEIRSALGYSPDQIVIGSVGRLEQQKRFDLLLAAFARVIGAMPRARLVIAGDGSLRGALEMQARELRIAGACSFLGHRDDIAHLHHAFDVFVQSSEYEGTPNAVLEAMAMETPVVATNAGGTAELMTHGVHGLVVPVRDADALAAAIHATIENRPAADLRVAAARQRVETELAFEARTRKLEALYDDLMKHRDRGEGHEEEHEAVSHA